MFRNSPFWIGDGAEGPGSAPEVGTLDPVGLVLEIVTRQTPRVGRIRLTVHNLQGSSGVRSVAEVLIAGHASHAGGENRGSRGGARWRAPGRQASEEPTTRFLHRVQLPAGYAILLFNVLAWIKRGRPAIPVDADAASRRPETTV